MENTSDRLLAADDREPVTVCSENDGSPFVIVADHAAILCRALSVGSAFRKSNWGTTSPGTSASVR
jgi:hypothetical protein